MIIDASQENLKWRGQWLGWLCCAMLILFTWLPASYYLMVALPWMIVWQMGFLLLGVWGIWMLRQFPISFRLLGYGLDWAVGLIALSLILSTIFCQFHQVAFWNLSLAFSYGVLIYVLRNWLEPGGLTLKYLWMGISWVGIITSFISLGSWIPAYLKTGIRNQFPMGQGNFIAGYVVLVLPLVFTWAISSQGWQRIVGLLGTLSLGITLYTTSSRGGFLGLIVVVIVGIGWFVFQAQGKQRWQRLGICLTLLIISFLLLLTNPRVQKLFRVSSNNSGDSIVEVSLEGEPQDRLFMWQASGNIFRSHPLFGVGAGNMSRMYNLYRPVEVGTGASAVQQLHNTPIQILGELGLLGLISQLFTLGTLAVLWFRLSRKISEVNECYLLYGIGASILGYTVSSLTDYQLENISISSSLVILIVLLIGLSDNYQLSSIGTLSRSKRRWLSLGGITAVVLALFIWIPVNFAMSLVVKSEQDFAAGNFEKAYQKISQASSLVPWDPIYSLLAGFQLLEARETIQDPFLFNQLTKLIAQQFENSQKAAPNDDVFNHNLGIIYQELQDPRQAQLYLSRATQLLSRVPYYTYYLLGQQYLKQGQDKKAATALSVQGLINPEFLTFSAWEKLPLSYIRETVVRETLSELETLWQQTSSNSIYNNIAVLKWWYKKPIQDIDLEKLSPINQALLLVEKTPQKSLEIINTALQENPKNFSLLLFRAWINPEEYLDEYLALNPNLNDGEKKLIQENINNYRNLRDWLVSRKVNLGKFYRQWLIFSYRNYNASKVAYALTPPDIQPYSRVEQLGLFSAYPQVFPPLDQLIAEIRSKQLELPNLQ